MRRSGGWRWGGIAHVFLAVALCLPLVAAAAAISVSMAQDASALNLFLLGLLALAFLAAVTWAALLPPVRQVEVSTARALLEYDGQALPDVRAPRAWPSRRRGAAWLLVLALVGLLVTAALVYLVPFGLSLLAAPFSGDSSVSWPGTRRTTHTGTGWHAAWLVAPGLLALAVCLAVLLGATRLLTAAAPRVLGPTLTERVAVAADRERALARANAVARDLHDRLGHTLTAMTVQATAARRLLPTDPDATDRALAAIEDLGRRAQADVDDVVRALRDGVDSAVGADVRDTDLVGLVDLVDMARALAEAAPLVVECCLPERLLLDRERAQTARAVILEALTNATRHGTGSATLGLRADGDHVVLEVRNPTAVPTSPRSHRAGVTGLRERLLLADGQVSAGPEGGDSWLVTARLPIAPPTPTG